MEPGIIAAVAILGVELVIIIVVVGYLLCRPKGKKEQTSELPESGGEYSDKNPEKVPEVTIVDEKDEVDNTYEPIGEDTPEKKDIPITEQEKDPQSAPDSLSDDATKTTSRAPSPSSEKPLDEPIKENEKVSSSSSDEGVGDVEKPASSSSDSSSSEDEAESSNEQEKEDPKTETVVPLKKEKSDSSSSSSSSSDSDDETPSVEEPVAITETEEKQEPEEVLAPVLMQEPQSTSEHTLGSLEGGIMLSLRLDNNTIETKKSRSSSSSSSSSSSEDDIKVIRTYDSMPTNNSTGDVAIIYDPLKHKVVNMDALRRQSSSSSSSDSGTDEPVNTEGDEVVAGIINVTSGEKLTICKAVSKGLIPEKTGMLLLEAQAATGSVVNPRTGVKMSVTDAVKQGVVDPHYKASLSASEGAYYGYLDPRKNESVPLFEAMRREIFPRAQGMRLLEAQVATGGIIDPWSGMRYSLAGALSKGLVDHATAKVLKNPEDHTDFYDPNTKQRFSYGDLLSKCIRDLNTGLKFLYIEEKPKTNTSQFQPDLLTFRSAFRRKVSFQDLISAGLVDKRTLDLFNRGQISKEELRERMKPYLTGDQPIAGIYNRSTKEVSTICQAVKSGLLRRGTALELLEAQAATGNIIDPKSGKQMSVSRAISIGLVDKQFAAPLRRAEMSVLGYQSGDRGRTVSLYEAMNKGQVLEVNGIRLLDAQIATGGLIDPAGGYRIPVSVATRRGLIDQRLADALAHPSQEQKAYYDPNTGENLTYGELLRRSVVDKKKHIGMRLLAINDKSPNVRMVGKGPTRSRKVIVMNPQSRKPMSLKQAVAAGVIDSTTARELQSHQGSWIEKSAA